MLAQTLSSDTESFDAVPVTGSIRRAPVSNPLTTRMGAGAVRTVEAREHIFCEGDPATHIFRVEAGHVCIYKTMHDGRRQIIDFAFPGDLIGLGAMQSHTSNAQATERTRVRSVPIATLHQVARDDGELGLELYRAMSRELMAARELLMTVSQRTAAERLAAFLVALTRRNVRNGQNAREIVLPMTRSDIADFLGLTIETVSRTFTKFRNEGLIKVAHCVLVTILDPEGLANMADGNGQ